MILSTSSAHARAPDPLEIFREALTLFRRAGLSWFEAEHPAYEAALSVVAPPGPEPQVVGAHAKAERREREEQRKLRQQERDEWATAIFSTRTIWMRAYENRDTGCEL